MRVCNIQNAFHVTRHEKHSEPIRLERFFSVTAYIYPVFSQLPIAILIDKDIMI